MEYYFIKCTIRLYMQVSNSDNSGEGFIHECDTMPVYEWNQVK